jgi:hypothetical protein
VVVRELSSYAILALSTGLLSIGFAMPGQSPRIPSPTPHVTLRKERERLAESAIQAGQVTTHTVCNELTVLRHMQRFGRRWKWSSGSWWRATSRSS